MSLWHTKCGISTEKPSWGSIHCWPGVDWAAALARGNQAPEYPHTARANCKLPAENPQKDPLGECCGRAYMDKLTDGPHGNNMFFSLLMDLWAFSVFLFTISHFFVSLNKMLQSKKNISLESIIMDYHILILCWKRMLSDRKTWAVQEKGRYVTGSCTFPFIAYTLL